MNTTNSLYKKITDAQARYQVDILKKIQDGEKCKKELKESKSKLTSMKAEIAKLKIDKVKLKIDKDNVIREFKHYKVNGFSITEAKRRLAEFENFYKNKLLYDCKNTKSISIETVYEIYRDWFKDEDDGTPWRTPLRRRNLHSYLKGKLKGIHHHQHLFKGLSLLDNSSDVKFIIDELDCDY